MNYLISRQVKNFEKSSGFSLLASLIDPSRPIFRIFLNHSLLVAAKAMQGANKVKHLNPDLQFILEASMFHDIGIIQTFAPDIDCFGRADYIEHGVLGAEILRKNGMDKLARVSETHIGVGITKDDIKKYNLPLPLKDYLPVSLEEKIIAWADKFYSKNPVNRDQQKSLDEILSGIEKYDKKKTAIFLEWNEMFD